MTSFILRSGRLLAALTVALGTLLAPVGMAPPAAAEPSNVLAYDFQWQQNGYYCGPAATRIALTARGYYDYSQDYIASQLHTTTDGTNSADDTTRVLNALGNTGFYESKWIPGDSATQEEIDRLQWDIVYDIDRGYPIVANIVGSAMDTDGDWHTYSGGHYLTVVGYSDDGWTAKIADPADANGYGWYWMSTVLLAHWIAARGYSA
jgi:hypothetical protein